MRTTIMQKLVETGEKERLKELLRQKLVECGWRDELKEYCKGASPRGRARAVGAPRRSSRRLTPRAPSLFAEVIRSKGLEKITVDELVAEITPRGRGAPPSLPREKTSDRRKETPRVRSNRARRGENRAPPEHPEIPPGARIPASPPLRAASLARSPQAT